MARPTWWRGERGEWYVVALFALIVLGPRNPPGSPVLQAPLSLLVTGSDAALAFLGLAMSLAGVLRLGPNLTPLPYRRTARCSSIAGRTRSFAIPSTRD